MAKTTTQRGKVKSIRVEDQPETDPTTSETVQTAAEVPAATPDAGPLKKIPKVLPFMKQVASIAKEDWGTRFQIKVYRLAPIIDRLRGSENKYVTIYHEPIDEEKLKVDHGSGRYRLYLNCKSPATKGEKEIDMIELDILDMAFPPKIPPSEWVDDPRNKQWAWAAPKGSAYHQGTQEQATAASSVSDNFKTFVEMQDQIEARMPKQEVIDPIAQAQATISLMKEAAALSKPAEGSGISKFLETEFASLRSEVAAARERGDRLMEKLIEAKTAAAPQTNGLGMLKEIISTVKEFMPTVKEMFPNAAEAIVRREKEPWWTGIATTAIEAVQPAMPVLVHGILQWAQRNQQTPQQNGKTIPTTATSTAPAAVPEPDIWELLINALSSDATGEDFAESVSTLYGQWKYKQACMLGENGLLTLLQNHPIWQKLGEAAQTRMPQFIHEFVSYGKDPDDDGAGGEPESDDPAEPQASSSESEAIAL